MADAGTAVLGRLRRRPLLTFAVAYLLVGLAWLATNPATACPDEDQHLIRAVSVIRGEPGVRIGSPAVPPIEAPAVERQRAFLERVTNRVDVPARLLVPGAACTALRGEVTADCYRAAAAAAAAGAAGQPGEGVASTTTFVAAYPPFLYLIEGLPSLVPGLEASMALRLMRLVCLLLVIGCLTLGLLPWVRQGRRSLPFLLLAALVPLTVFMGSCLSTSGVEIAAVAGLFLAAAALVRALVQHRRPHPTEPLGLGVLVAALTLARPGGIAFAGAVILLAAIGEVARPRAVRWRPALHELWGRARRPVVLAAVLVAAATLAGLWWQVVGGGGRINAWDLRLDAVIGENYARLPELLREALGTLGHSDTPVPAWALAGFVALWWWMAQRAAPLGAPRSRQLLAAVAGTFAFAVVASMAMLSANGFIVQGRYVLPVLQLLPVGLALAVSDRSPEPMVVAGRRLDATVVVAGVWGLLTTIALWTNLRRYAVGVNGPVFFWGETGWRPTAWPWWAVVFLAGVGLAVAGARAAGPYAGDDVELRR